MHYIRFLKPPKTIRITTSPPSITAKITITTDLGESFLAADISLLVTLLSPSGISLGTREYTWKGRNGMRALEVAVFVPKRMVGEVEMHITPKKKELVMSKFEDILRESEGGVVAVKSTLVNSDKGNEVAGMMAARAFGYDLGSESRDEKRQILIWEETGESIARHIWDAGLVLSACITSTLQTTTLSPASGPSHLPFIKSLLHLPSPHILELGAGCGIVGLTLCHILPNSKTSLTDLAEASEILSLNIKTAYPSPISEDRITHQILDWSLPLPPSIQLTEWDLVLVADCTYNPDVVPDLVKTLKALVYSNGDKESKVVLAMKVRHESELIFFDLMEEAGFIVREKNYVPLPVLAGADEEIEIFEFGYRG